MPQERKSRGGCARCKERKVKCDEDKPFCQRCVSLRLQCPGYQPRLRWSTKYEVYNKDRPVHRRSKVGQSGNDPSSPRASPIATTSSHGTSVRPSESNSRPLTLSKTQPTSQEREHDMDWIDFNWTGELEGLLHSDSSLFDLQVSPNINRRPNDAEPNGGGHRSAEPGDPQLGEILLSGLSADANAPEFMNIESTISEPLVSQDSVLVEYYFKTVATFYSCFDGPMNPFRTTIGRLWSSSQILTLTLQSLAAACLCRDLPQLSQEGFRLRKQAFNIIEDEVSRGQLSEVSLLSLIMLGQSASWHRPSDVGIVLYRLARTVVHDDSPSGRDGLKSGLSHTNTPFFQQALQYWRMLLSFVCEVEDSNKFLSPEPIQSSDLRLQTVPHPWALIAPDMMSNIGEVGRLVYDSRRRARELKFWRVADSDYIQQSIHRIKQLETYLLNYKLPIPSEVVDPSDDLSPVPHFLAISEAYRLVALLQIYRVFPDVLLERLFSTDQDASWITLVELLGQSSSTSRVNQLPKDCPESWMMGLAMHIVQTLMSVPFESHTRSIQAFLLVAISSELRKSVGEGSNRVSTFVEAIQARNFVMSRLEGYRFVFAPKPAERKINLVLKIWEELDRSTTPVYWMDVMIKNDLEVLFC